MCEGEIEYRFFPHTYIFENLLFTLLVYMGADCSYTMYLKININVHITYLSSGQFSSVAQSCLTLCDPVNRSTPGLPVHHQLPESTQSIVHWVSDAIQPSHPLYHFSCLQSFPTSGSFQMSQIFDQVAKILEFQLQHQSFQWTPRTDFP